MVWNTVVFIRDTWINKISEFSFTCEYKRFQRFRMFLHSRLIENFLPKRGTDNENNIKFRIELFLVIRYSQWNAFKCKGSNRVTVISSNTLKPRWSKSVCPVISSLGHVPSSRDSFSEENNLSLEMSKNICRFCKSGRRISNQPAEITSRSEMRFSINPTGSFLSRTSCTIRICTSAFRSITSFFSSRPGNLLPLATYIRYC